MGEWEIVIGAVLLALACLYFGAAWGLSTEREAWVLRAMTREKPDSTPHCCNGTFYYIVEESVFVHGYTRHRGPPPPDNEEGNG